MGKEESCEVCGGTESKLVDGYYYCAECGTQDMHVRETLVEHQMLDDGKFAIGRRTKYSVKMKEGVEMSHEWYKWHTYNFVLAGLTEQLIELGAAPSLRTKVLWIWCRYIKMYQKKDEMSRFRVLTLLEEQESPSAGAGAGEGAGEGDKLRARCRRGPRLDRVNRQVLCAVLALALNFDRSPLQVSHFTRFVTFRLLTVNDALRFVPAEILSKHKQLELGLQGTLFYCNDLPLVMGRLTRMLDLGAPRVPDVEVLLASQLRELRLPRGLARLVRALVHLLPLPWEPRDRKDKDVPKFPDYETVVLAYILVALKMCFGLDDDYEVRLSDTVDRINREERRPRTYSSDPEPTDRLFSFSEWCVHLQHRALLLSQQYGPLAWQRNMRASDFALMEHFEEFTTVWAPKNEKKKNKPLLTDEVTMDIIGKIPRKGLVGVLPLAELRPAAAAPEPAAALARLVAPSLPPEHRRLLDEDFTQYSLEYACSRLALPSGDHAFRGVGLARKELHKEIGLHLVSSEGDPTIVYVKDCENKHWAKTRRPTAAHVLEDGERQASPGLPCGGAAVEDAERQASPGLPCGGAAVEDAERQASPGLPCGGAAVEDAERQASPGLPCGGAAVEDAERQASPGLPCGGAAVEDAERQASPGLPCGGAAVEDAERQASPGLPCGGAAVEDAERQASPGLQHQRQRGEEKLETFEEEAEGTNIFDDDFFSIKIKEEKAEIAPDPSETLKDETKDDISFYDEVGDEFESTRRESAGERSRGGERVFDSDEEQAGPQLDPATFNRAETIKQIMIAAYRKYISTESKIPVRFRTTHRPPKERNVAKRPEEDNQNSKGWVRKREIVDGKAAVDKVVLAYQNSLATDAMHQVAQQVQSFVDYAAGIGQQDPDPPDHDPPDASAGDMDVDPDESRDVQVIENDAKDADDNDDSFDGPVYDPIYKGDVRFDEKTHDASQLFLRLKAAPPADAAPDEDSVLDDIDNTLDTDSAVLHEERKRKLCERTRSKMKWRRRKENIDHLVDDPESITEFNYWCKHYKYFKSWGTKSVQEEMDESFPRSFRFVMRESAAMLGVPQNLLYQRVCDVERVMLSLLWRPAPRSYAGRSKKKKRKPSVSSTPDKQPKTKISKNTKNYAEVSRSKRNNAKVSNNNPNNADVPPYTSDEASDTEVVSDEPAEREVLVTDEEREPARRSGRLRRKAAGHPFWR